MAILMKVPERFSSEVRKKFAGIVPDAPAEDGPPTLVSAMPTFDDVEDDVLPKLEPRPTPPPEETPECPRSG